MLAHTAFTHVLSITSSALLDLTEQYCVSVMQHGVRRKITVVAVKQYHTSSQTLQLKDILFVCNSGMHLRYTITCLAYL